MIDSVICKLTFFQFQRFPFVQGIQQKYHTNGRSHEILNQSNESNNFSSCVEIVAAEKF